VLRGSTAETPVWVEGQFSAHTLVIGLGHCRPSCPCFSQTDPLPPFFALLRTPLLREIMLESGEALSESKHFTGGIRK